MANTSEANADEWRHWTRFHDLVLADPELHNQLRAAAGEAAFIALTVELGRKHDCHFSAPLVAQALREQRRAWVERWV